MVTIGSNSVFEIISINVNDNDIITLNGCILQNITDAFDKPIMSSFLNIFGINCNNIRKFEATVNITDIKCKLVAIEYGSYVYLIPLIHTLK